MLTKEQEQIVRDAALSLLREGNYRDGFRGDLLDHRKKEGETNGLTQWFIILDALYYHMTLEDILEYLRLASPREKDLIDHAILVIEGGIR
jgi:hypothetical protein